MLYGPGPTRRERCDELRAGVAFPTMRRRTPHPPPLPPKQTPFVSEATSQAVNYTFVVFRVWIVLRQVPSRSPWSDANAKRPTSMRCDETNAMGHLAAACPCEPLPKRHNGWMAFAPVDDEQYPVVVVGRVAGAQFQPRTLTRSNNTAARRTVAHTMRCNRSLNFSSPLNTTHSHNSACSAKFSCEYLLH